MAELDWDDPRLTRLVQRIVDRRAERLIAKSLPEPHYGDVVAVNATQKTCTVRYRRPGADDDVPGIKWAGFTPTVGMRVRTIYWPKTGERYVDAQVG